MTGSTTDQKDKEVYVGAVIKLNGKDVNLIPSTPINKIDEHGFQLSLDKPLDLGDFGRAMKSICEDIGVENPLAEDKVKKISVPLLKNAAQKLNNASILIEALQYEKPPESDKDSKYVFVASVNWKDEQNGEQSQDFFKLKGLIVGISKGFTDNQKGENLEVQKAFQSALQAMLPARSLSGSQ